MQKKSIASNIKRFRNVKGVSQKKLADESGVTVLSISNLERGVYEPKSSTLMSISKVLEVPLQDFFQPPPELHSVRFRMQKSLTRKEKNAKEQLLLNVFYWLKDFNWLEEKTENRKPYLFDNMSLKGGAEQIAKQARKCLSLASDSAISSLGGILERAGIKIYQTPISLKKFFGLSVGKEDGGPAICVNTSSAISIERQIFSGAHELGHLLMHQDSYGKESLLENEKEESEANAFASYFLMPHAVFLKEWNATKGLHLVNRVLHLKRMFKVSYKTVLFRLSEMEKNRNLYLIFNTEFQKYYNHDLKNFYEPDALVQSDFIEDRFPFLVRLAHEKRHISIGRAAEMLKKSLVEMRELKNSWSLIE